MIDHCGYGLELVGADIINPPPDLRLIENLSIPVKDIQILVHQWGMSTSHQYVKSLELHLT